MDSTLSYIEHPVKVEFVFDPVNDNLCRCSYVAVDLDAEDLVGNDCSVGGIDDKGAATVPIADIKDLCKDFLHKFNSIISQRQSSASERSGMNDNVDSVVLPPYILADIRMRSRTLQGEGYWTHGGTPTRAAEDVRWLLGEIDRISPCEECNQVNCVCDHV